MRAGEGARIRLLGLGRVTIIHRAVEGVGAMFVGQTPR